MRRVQGKSRFRYLPNAEEEAKAVGGLFGSSSKIRTGDAARESFLKANALTECDIIHIAGHVYADEMDPLAELARRRSAARGRIEERAEKT